MLAPLPRCLDEQRRRSPVRSGRERPRRRCGARPRRGRRGRRSRRPPRSEPEGRDGLSVPAGGFRGSFGAGNAGRVLASASRRTSLRTRRRTGVERRSRKRSCCRDREQEREESRDDDEESDPYEPRVKRPFNSAVTQPATARPGPSRFHRRAIVGAPATASPPERSDAQLFDHPPRRRRGIDSDAAHVPARAGRLHRRPGARRRGGAPPVRGGLLRPRRPRCHAPAPRRPRGVQAAPKSEQRPDHHAHRTRRGARQGARARARRRRLHHRSRSRSGSFEAGCGRFSAAPARRTSRASARR